jgi:hypothetical protein
MGYEHWSGTLDSRMPKFPVFFPVSREFSGEELARDCRLRHAVCNAEKSQRYSSVNREKSPQLRRFCSQNGSERVTHFTQQASFVALFSEGHIGSPVSTTQPGECDAITKRCVGETDLTSRGAFGTSHKGRQGAWSCPDRARGRSYQDERSLAFGRGSLRSPRSGWCAYGIATHDLGVIGLQQLRNNLHVVSTTWRTMTRVALDPWRSPRSLFSCSVLTCLSLERMDVAQDGSVSRWNCHRSPRQ